MAPVSGITFMSKTSQRPICARLITYSQGVNHRFLNCGYGRGFSVRQVLDTIEQVSGKHLSIVETERRAGDPANFSGRQPCGLRRS